ncbi:unnamed protein product [Psylliodes chrysocephalus]|uniref:C2H2-type domain-containing protein n=1 Tax=Psylliodes chrysocephalus TaxID=3402493 RepID=A0A9P0CN17_9CUCU|nr:unnamed protein product [Psylliodes chrysocephala]
MASLYLLVNLIAIVMSGEINNRVEDLPFNFLERKDEKNSNDGETENEKKQDDSKKEKPWLSCDICKVTVTSAKIFQRHLDGRKHKLRVEREGKEFKCDLCDISTNSEIQLEIHLRSLRHKAKLQKKEHPRLATFNFFTSKISLLIFVTFICIVLNLFLLCIFFFS